VQRLNLLINQEVIVELKAVKEISNVHISQVISYLRATGIKTALIFNFSKPILEIKRVKLDKLEVL
jgi:GxxExxY protein